MDIVANRPVRARFFLLALAACTAISAAAQAAQEPRGYKPINPTMENKTVTLTGYDLTIEDAIAVARYGAKVQFTPEAIKRATEAAGLRTQAGEQGMAVYGLNRGGGALREEGRPLPINAETPGVFGGAGPEVDEEDLVRAVMVLGANMMPTGTASAAAMQANIDMLNNRITPVAYSRGTLGESDFPALAHMIGSAIRGHGDVYYEGVRMTAMEAFKKAGLKPTNAGGGGGNTYASALALLMVVDGRELLEWTDLVYAMDKIGMNSSITPMTAAVQARRPFKWVNWDAARIMDMLRGSYLFEADPKRILQDPQSLRASYIRQGSAWQAWSQLRDDLLLQMNSSTANPVFVPGLKPEDSWELSTPHFMKYFVKGGEASKGISGYATSTANWDPYPMTNSIEAFTNALGNMGAVVAQRIERFTDRGPTAFFTGIKPKDVMTPEQIMLAPSLIEPFFIYMDIWAEIQSLSTSVTAEGNAIDLGVADIEAFSRVKGFRGRQVIDLMYMLLAHDLWNAAYWLDVRKIEDPKRNFGKAPTAVWEAFRKVQPWQMETAKRPQIPYGVVAYDFMKANRASSFYSGGPPMPGGDDQRDTRFVVGR